MKIEVTTKESPTVDEKLWACLDRCNELGVNTKEVEVMLINGKPHEWNWVLEDEEFKINGVRKHWRV
jgi:redox-sensitive bicupin YhaK (pirin superfamily)